MVVVHLSYIWTQFTISCFEIQYMSVCVCVHQVFGKAAAAATCTAVDLL